MHKITDGGAYLEYEESSEMTSKSAALVTSDGDKLPRPKKLGVSDYTYLSFITVPFRRRNRGVARKLIARFLTTVHGPILTRLVDCCSTHGTVLEPLLRRCRFRVVRRVVNIQTDFKDVMMLRK